MNTELFVKVDTAITLEPHSFSMAEWEYNNVCGTTRCIAGHAIHQTTGQPLYGQGDELHQSVIDLARSLGIAVDEESPDNFEYIAAKLLDIDRCTAAKLFYISDERGRNFVALAAAGREDEALSLLDD